jgi:hypothetical protein
LREDRKMIEWKVDGKTVTIDDWDGALIAASNLDKLEPGEDRSLIQRKSALRILAEYGLKLYQAAHPGEETELKLAIVIDENVVYILPSKDGKDGVFIGEYSPEKYGEWVAKKLAKDDLWGFSNIEAMLDGSTFFAEMLNHGREAVDQC